MHQIQQETAVSAFPVGVVTANQVFGVPINDLVLWATLIYVLFQIAVILPKVIDTVKSKFKPKKDDCNVD